MSQIRRRTRTRVPCLGLATLLLASAAGASPEQWRSEGREAVARAKQRTERTRARNVILFVGDGMGVSTVTAARILTINVTGTFLISKYALPLLRKSDGASVINFGSYDGFIADPELAAYCATKGAVHALTRAMACDHGKEGIRVNAVCPGYVDTPLVRAQVADQARHHGMDPSDVIERIMLSSTPKRNWISIEELTAAVSFLASPLARNITGQIIGVDGGITI